MEGVQMVSLSLGYVMGQAISAAAKLGIADALDRGAMAIDELARATDTHEPSLARLMRTLASGGVFAVDDVGRYTNTPLGETLRTDTPGSVKDAVIWVSEPMHYGTCGDLASTVATGALAFDRMFGRPYFEQIASDPAVGRVWDRGMACFSSMEDGPIAAACPIPVDATVVDVGGGQGGFLAELLQREPSARGVLFDIPDVVANPAKLAGASLTGRYRTVAGDFFAEVPPGGDVYVYKRVLHDWDDDRCIALLQRCRAAIADGGTLLVIDAVIPDGTDPHPAKIVDIVMLGILPGRERTEAEFVRLLDAAGFALKAVHPTHSMLAIVEATPV
jgi:hypothetical protein